MENVGVAVIMALGVTALWAAGATGRRGLRRPHQPEPARLPALTPDAERHAALRAVRDEGRGDTDPASG